MTATAKQKTPTTGKHRGYIFGVTFLACLVGALIFWPTSRPTYRSQAIVSIEREDGTELDHDQVASRLKTASREVLSRDSLQQICDKIPGEVQGSKLLDADQHEALRAAMQVGVSPGDTNSSYLVSVSLHGAGTKDEIEFINCVANKLISRLDDSNSVENYAGMSDEIREQFRISQARVNGLRNAGELISSQQVRKLHATTSIEFDQSDESIKEIPNPAWSAYRSRLQELIRLRDKLELSNRNGTSLETVVQSTSLREEIRVLKSQYDREPKSLRFEFQQVASAEAVDAAPEEKPLPVVRSDFSSDQPDGFAVRKNEFFTDTDEATPEAPKQNGVRLVSHEQSDLADGTLAEINSQIRAEENRQSRMHASLISEVNRPRQVAHPEFLRLLKPAIKSRPTTAGVTRNQFLMMLLLSLAFGMAMSFSANSVMGGNKFRTAEEVSRKLGIALMGVVAVSGDGGMLSESNQSVIVRRTILACELILIAFAIVMLATTILHSDIVSSIRQNPVIGIMEAIRVMRPW